MAKAQETGVDDFLAFIRLDGESLGTGLINAKTGSNILAGVDRIVRRGLIQSYPELLDLNFDVPVLVKRGSWTALIPTDVIGWVRDGIGAAGTVYLSTAAQKMATKDFTDKGIRDAIKASVRSLQSASRITKHLKGTRKSVESGVRFEDNNQTLVLPNDEGQYLKVTRSEYEEYLRYPEDLLASIGSSPKQDQVLSIGVIDDKEVVTEAISSREAQYFGEPESPEHEMDVLFPEMKHGDSIELEGRLTKANSQTNNMGFKYKGHILTCTPRKGSIEAFKPQLFTKCILRGTVQRLIDNSVKDTMLRPRLVFDELEIIEEDAAQTRLV